MLYMSAIQSKNTCFRDIRDEWITWQCTHIITSKLYAWFYLILSQFRHEQAMNADTARSLSLFLLISSKFILSYFFMMRYYYFRINPADSFSFLRHFDKADFIMCALRFIILRYIYIWRDEDLVVCFVCCGHIAPLVGEYNIDICGWHKIDVILPMNANPEWADSISGWVYILYSTIEIQLNSPV